MLGTLGNHVLIGVQPILRQGSGISMMEQLDFKAAVSQYGNVAVDMGDKGAENLCETQNIAVLVDGYVHICDTDAHILGENGMFHCDTPVKYPWIS